MRITFRAILRKQTFSDANIRKYKLNTKLLDYKKLPDDLKRRLDDLQKAIENELPRRLGVVAHNHFTDNFRKGGFINSGLKKWQNVKRRDPNSSWYGFEYRGEKRTSYAFTRGLDGKTRKAAKQKRLNFSATATQRAVLTSSRNRLMNSLKIAARKGEIEIYSDEPHADIHNNGGQFKVFGKRSATMPQRQFIGPSAELDKLIEDTIIAQIDKVFK